MHSPHHLSCCWRRTWLSQRPRSAGCCCTHLAHFLRSASLITSRRYLGVSWTLEARYRQAVATSCRRQCRAHALLSDRHFNSWILMLCGRLATASAGLSLPALLAYVQ